MSEVVLGAPYSVTPELLDHFKVQTFNFENWLTFWLCCSVRLMSLSTVTQQFYQIRYLFVTPLFSSIFKSLQDGEDPYKVSEQELD